MKTYATLSDAYLGTLEDILDYPAYVCSPRGQKIHETLDYTFRVLNPTSDSLITKDSERNKKLKEYLEKEKELYAKGTTDVKDFEEASRFWSKLQNPDGTVNSSYGYLIWKNKSVGNPKYEAWKEGETYLNTDFDIPIHHLNWVEKRQAAERTPWEWAKMSLIEDKDTRQAIMPFSLPSHYWHGNKDFTCTLHGHFMIRDDKLHFSIVMRSNDAVLGLAYDSPWFIHIQEQMLEELKTVYPELKMGTYTHRSNSMHIYERNFEMVRKMLGRV